MFDTKKSRNFTKQDMILSFNLKLDHIFEFFESIEQFSDRARYTYSSDMTAGKLMERSW